MRRGLTAILVSHLLLFATPVVMIEAHDDPHRGTISANGAVTIGAVQVGEGQPGIVIHELVTHCNVTCVCDPGRHAKRLMGLLLMVEWRTYKYTNLREYADWLWETERKMEDQR